MRRWGIFDHIPTAYSPVSLKSAKKGNRDAFAVESASIGAIAMTPLLPIFQAFDHVRVRHHPIHQAIEVREAGAGSRATSRPLAAVGQAADRYGRAPPRPAPAPTACRGRR